MKVLVTGSSGMVGGIVVPELRERGHEVVTFDLKDGQNIHAQAHRDLAIDGCEVVVHLAAIPWPDQKREWKEFYWSNCSAVQEIADSAYRFRARRFIYTSSTAYYGMEQGIPFRSPVDESSPHGSQFLTAKHLRGATPAQIYYMQSKVIAENILAAYGLTRQMEVAILRMAPLRESADNPYCGLWMGDLDIVGRTIADLVEDPGELWYEVFNLADPDCEALNTDKLRGDERSHCA